MISLLNSALSIVSNTGIIEDHFRVWAQEVTQNVRIEGDGTPEAVVTARQYSVYIDRLGSTGSIIYVKMQAEIGGDRSKGWELS